MDTSVNIPNQELIIMFSLEQICSILTIKVETTKSLTNALINHGIDGLTIIDYFLVAHRYLFPTKTIDFMQEFIEMCDKEDEFCVPHTRLCQLDIAQERKNGGSKLEKIIRCLTTTNGFEEGKDFKVIMEGRAKKIMMKPGVFKKCLMNAKNTDIFRDYYILLERIFVAYQYYQLQCKEKMLALVRESNKELLNKQDELLNKQDELIAMNKNLMAYAKSTNDMVASLYQSFSIFAKMIIPTWIGSTVIKQQYELIFSKTEQQMRSIRSLKVMFVIAVLNDEDAAIPFDEREDEDLNTHTDMFLYCCCTNIRDIPQRIKEIHDRHCIKSETNPEPKYVMLAPRAVTMISSEINVELNTLMALDVFPSGIHHEWNSKYKRFDISIYSEYPCNAQVSLNEITNNIYSKRFQGYQARIDEMIATNPTLLKKEIIDYLDNVDMVFYDSTRANIQEYLDLYVRPQYYSNEEEIPDNILSWRYTTKKTGKVKERYPEFNKKLTKIEYQAMKLYSIIDKQSSIDHIGIMQGRNILTEHDAVILREIAKVEQIEYDAELDNLIEATQEAKA
jgi:hypothetical protein